MLCWVIVMQQRTKYTCFPTSWCSHSSAEDRQMQMNLNNFQSISLISTMKERSERLKDQDCTFINRPNIDFQTLRISSYMKNKRKKLSAEKVVYIYIFFFYFFLWKRALGVQKTERSTAWLQHRGNKEDIDDEFEEIDRTQIMHDWSDHDKKFGFYCKWNGKLLKRFEQVNGLSII